MEPLVKIAGLNNEIEALCLKGELERRDIPFLIRTNRDTAYDGLFQFVKGWGVVEAPESRREEVLTALDAIREVDESDLDAAADAPEDDLDT